MGYPPHGGRRWVQGLGVRVKLSTYREHKQELTMAKSGVLAYIDPEGIETHEAPRFIVW